MVTFDYIKGKRQGQIRCDPDLLEAIRNHFSAKNDAAAFIKDPNKKKFIASRKYAITPTGLFDFGIFSEIRKHLIELQIIDVTYTQDFTNRVKSGFSNWEYWDGLNNTPRYFQKETVEQCMKFGYGTYLIGTGGGKSYIQALLIENFIRNRKEKTKCLVVVPGTSLVHQLLGDFLDYNVTFKFSGWTGESDTKGNYTMPLQDTDVVICNSEILNSQFEKNMWVTDIDLLLQDECHRINKEANISKMIKKIKTPNKFGFTGSLSDKKIDNWKTIGIFGPVLYEKKSKELRDEKFLTDVNVTVIRLNHQRPRKMTYLQELDYIYESEGRNNIIRKFSGNLKGNTLILVNHLKHGDALVEALSGIKKKVYFVKGEMDVSEREAIKKIMETDDDIVTIAMSSIFSTGINIKNIHNILFVAGGKSFIRTVQSIGRGLRLHDNKNILTIIDIYDNLKYSERHVEERKAIYDKEQIPWSEKQIEIL